MHFITFVIPLAFLINQVSTDYLNTRSTILQAEKATAIGGNIVLTKKEKEANDILLAVKNRELQGVHQDVTRFPPVRHFFDARSDIEKSKVFSIIQKLPKGASLHTHLTASVSLDYVLSNLIQRDNLYGCTINGRLKLRFFKIGGTDKLCKWELVKDLRKKQSSFDAWVKSQISLLNDGNPQATYNDIHGVWEAFIGAFATVYDMISYKPVFQDFLYQALQELYTDKVVYVEFRQNLPELYELNGVTYKFTDFLQIFSETVQRFKREHPGFVGAKIIYSPNRKLNTTDLEQALSTFHSLQNAHPNVLAGFDLVGLEDAGRPLVDFHQQLKNVQGTTNFFFHAGETNWYGFEADHNLIDAVLLGTKRIGHGYALLKHPKVLEMVKQTDIAIELSPISNQVLMFVDDLRNHPASALIAQGFPIVVCNDDPGFWGAKGLSYDWYMVYMSMTSKDAGLELLKQLGLNSIKYSSLSEPEKTRAIQEWNTAWGQFVDDLIKNKANY